MDGKRISRSNDLLGLEWGTDDRRVLEVKEHGLGLATAGKGLKMVGKSESKLGTTNMSVCPQVFRGRSLPQPDELDSEMALVGRVTVEMGRHHLKVMA